MLNYSIFLAKRELVNSIWKSAGIEGLGTTFPDTEAILENLPVTTRRDEVLFIVNMKRGWEFLFDNIEYPITLSLLRELNKITMVDLLYNAGEVRKGIVTIGGTTWTPEIPNEGVIISTLQEILNNDDPLDVALDLFCYVARTQIFTDGNKRLATLLANKYLIHNDIGILAVPYDRIKEFKELLVCFYESNDSTKLKSFFKRYCIIYNPDYNSNFDAHKYLMNNPNYSMLPKASIDNCKTKADCDALLERLSLK